MNTGRYIVVTHKTGSKVAHDNQTATERCNLDDAKNKKRFTAQDLISYKGKIIKACKYCMK